MLAFTAKRLITPTETVEHPRVLVSDGKVVEIVDGRARPSPAGAQIVDLGDGMIAPGYIDLHIHGSAGFDVMDDKTDALPTVEGFLARHGVTSYYPTTVTAPMETTLQALERLADAIESRSQDDKSKSDKSKSKERRACPLGIHLEGPFISHLRKGVHPAADLLPPKVETFERFWQAARGHIRIMTIAPELEGAEELIAEAARRGVCVSLGHSDADFDSSARGIAAGARHATHTFNAMRPLDHRAPGILGAVLTDSRLSADIIADGVHLDPAIVKLVANAKGLELTVLITDATAATGMPDGRYHLGSMEVDVKDGRCIADGKLAGSILTMDKAVRNLARFAGWSLSQAVAAASRNPALVAGFANNGVLAAGADADFVVLNAVGEVLKTFVGGVECSAP
jgi:N-acetylglucosamine-6-phosphate deacetylase